MTQSERRIWLIQYLLDENKRYSDVEIPPDREEQFRLFRSLVNVRMPHPVSEEFLKIQNEYLAQEISQKGITDIKDLTPVQEDICIWQGDITTLKCDAVVNAANSQLLGCFFPCHACIDNCIHTFSGVQLRLFCNEMMQKQLFEEPTGSAKITPAFNLPSSYVIHTVGPIISGALRQRDKELLASCYRECLKLADEKNLKSIAFCCISTGEFHFPNDKAAEIAVNTVRDYKRQTGSEMKVIFNVFKEYDLQIYKKLLG